MNSTPIKPCGKHSHHENFFNGECQWCISEERSALQNATGFDTFDQALQFIKDQRGMMDSVNWAMANKPSPDEHKQTESALKRAVVPELTTAVKDVLRNRIDWTDDVPEALDVQRGTVYDGIRVLEYQGRYIHADDIAKLLGIEP